MFEIIFWIAVLGLAILWLYDLRDYLLERQNEKDELERQEVENGKC